MHAASLFDVKDVLDVAMMPNCMMWCDCDDILDVERIYIIDVIRISDGLTGQPHDEMQVVEDEYARDGLMKFTLGDITIDDVGCILIFDVQFDVVSV